MNAHRITLREALTLLAALPPPALHEKWEAPQAPTTAQLASLELVPGSPTDEAGRIAYHRNADEQLANLRILMGELGGGRIPAWGLAVSHPADPPIGRPERISTEWLCHLGVVPIVAMGGIFEDSAKRAGFVRVELGRKQTEAFVAAERKRRKKARPTADEVMEWMRQYFVAERERTGAPPKRDAAVDDCHKTLGVPTRAARAAWNKMPIEQKRTTRDTDRAIAAARRS